MIQLYDKDDCAPDALSAKQWILSQGMELLIILSLEGEFCDICYNLCVTSDLRFLLIEFSCGIYETVQELTQEEARKHLKFAKKPLDRKASSLGFKGAENV